MNFSRTYSAPAASRHLSSRVLIVGIASLFLTVILCVVAISDAAMAQGAATGGVNDTGSPTMVFPVRPRDGPAPSTAVPNVARGQQHVVPFRQHYYRYHPYRLR
jgi:hypothetical protein